MCFTRKYRKSKKKVKRSNKIIPVTIKIDDEKSILDELIYCNGCKKHHKSDEFKIHCSNCYKFYHCRVAGRCIGKNCSIGGGDNCHRLGYCLNCVDLNLDINTDNTNNCICKECQVLI